MILKRKLKTATPNHKNTMESLRIGVILAMVAGLMDVYTYITRGGVFATAETGNLVKAVIGFFNKDYEMTFNATMQLLFFVLGTLFYEFLKHKREKENNDEDYHAKRILIIEALILFVVGFINEDAPDILVNSIVAFISAIQISAFRKLVDSPYSTTVFTGNLRMLGENLFKSIDTKDKVIIDRFLRYLSIIISFLVGGFLGGYLTTIMGVKSIFIAVILLLVGYGCFYYDDYIERKNKVI